MSAGYERFERAAGRIARDGDGADLASNMVELLRARQQVRAGVAVVKAEDALVGTLLDVFA